jgi:hypothetical protein
VRVGERLYSGVRVGLRAFMASSRESQRA